MDNSRRLAKRNRRRHRQGCAHQYNEPVEGARDAAGLVSSVPIHERRVEGSEPAGWIRLGQCGQIKDGIAEV